MRVFCVFFILGKLGYGEVFSSFDERRPAYFFQPSKVPSRGNSLMSCCSNFFDDWHWDACSCLWQLTGDLLVMVPSIQVACLLAHCVLIGSLAELLFSFCMQNVLAFFADGWCYQWQGDIINGYCLGFKSPLQYLTLSWCSAKNKVIQWLTILVVLDCIRFWLEPLAISISVGLGHIRLWREPSVISVLKKFSSPLAEHLWEIPFEIFHHCGTSLFK
jgi:hypothetical protein